MRSSRVIQVGLLALLAGGCATHPHRALWTRVSHGETGSKAAFAAPLTGRNARLAVIPTILTGSRASKLESGQKEYIFDRERFDDILVETLKGSGGFRRVVYMNPGKGPGGASVPAEGLVLGLELESHSVRYVSGSANQGLVIAMWYLLLGLPAQWIHDEIYELRFSGRGIISDRETGRLLQEVNLGDCAADSSLNFLERTSSVGTWLLSLLVPPPAISPDEEALMQALAPAALADAVDRLRPGFQMIEQGIVEPEPVVPVKPPPEKRIWIRYPTAPGVAFAFRDPREGDLGERETIDLDFDLVFPQDSTDLVRVSINGEVIVRYDQGRPVPVEKRLPLKRENVPLVDGKVTISVSLYSAMVPVEAVIFVSDGAGED